MPFFKRGEIDTINVFSSTKSDEMASNRDQFCDASIPAILFARNFGKL